MAGENHDHGFGSSDGLGDKTTLHKKKKAINTTTIRKSKEWAEGWDKIDSEFLVFLKFLD